MRVAAPCPHSGACPIEPGTDWCHFAARQRAGRVAGSLPGIRLRAAAPAVRPVPAPAAAPACSTSHCRRP
ncbi:small ribosomal subunit Rsm22 family protein [Streptomyces sp. NPDC058595]|uniref:small ribosomal subunit Rsm22 family protein n=1 Tax=Streptomyces sp. NPDC058595 TaxID=3346550 RepID=UPI00365A5793